ncbi:hypothetical protein LOTGIDRAFT_236151 [Lottia gigantea]|uniref:Uncharacterized protein n=1 Tax=Lottia gigantea TaxID=225164 RepID=V3ZK57_LOTGI|nr:hypothetical protein LOTGIDRAFT_236151 [Lottia gigantea]ESO84637.1 hypothetical protein LOTGIDRAFT_236151 [Lottia gigantea]
MNFSLSPGQNPKTENSAMNLHQANTLPALKHRLDCLMEEDEDVDYPPPRLITGLPEPINVDDSVNKRRPRRPEIVSPKAPCLLYTTEEVKDYIDHLEMKLNILYKNMQETNRYLFEVLEEKDIDKIRIKNQQRLLNQQEVELIFYRQFYKTGKKHGNEPISEENKLKAPPKTEFFKYSFGKKLNIEMHPVDVDPDIKDAVDQKVQDVLQAQADKDQEILPPSQDFHNILYINHSTEESKDEDFYTTGTPSPEPVLYDVTLEFQDKDSTLQQYNPLGSPGSSSTASSPSPIQDTSNVDRDSDTFEKLEIYEAPLQFRDKGISNVLETDATSRSHEIVLTERTEHLFDNVQLQEELYLKESENDNQPSYPSRSLSPKREVNDDVCVRELLGEKVRELPEADYQEDGECEATTESFQETTFNLMASIKELSTEITKETERQDVKVMDTESLTEKERRIIEEIEKYVGIDDTLDTLGKVPYVPSSADTMNFQLDQKLDLVSDYARSRNPLPKKEVRALTALPESRGSKKRVKALPIEVGKRRYPLQPVYRSNTQKTILPPIRPNNKTNKPQSKFTNQEKLGPLPDITIDKSCTPKKSEPVLYKPQATKSNIQPSKQTIDELTLPKLPIVHTAPIIKDNKHRTDNGFSLPQIKTASRKSHLRDHLKTNILPDKLKPGNTSSQYTASTSSTTRHFTKSANYKPPKVLLPVQPKIYRSNRRKEKQPHKLPYICQLGLDDLFLSRKD